MHIAKKQKCTQNKKVKCSAKIKALKQSKHCIITVKTNTKKNSSNCATTYQTLSAAVLLNKQHTLAATVKVVPIAFYHSSRQQTIYHSKTYSSAPDHYCSND